MFGFSIVALQNRILVTSALIFSGVTLLMAALAMPATASHSERAVASAGIASVFFAGMAYTLLTKSHAKGIRQVLVSRPAFVPLALSSSATTVSAASPSASVIGMGMAGGAVNAGPALAVTSVSGLAAAVGGAAGAGDSIPPGSSSSEGRKKVA